MQTFAEAFASLISGLTSNDFLSSADNVELRTDQYQTKGLFLNRTCISLIASKCPI